MADKIFGAMLDCSRNAVMKPEEVKNFAGILKSFGYNALMLYTEDTYEVNGEPYFGYMRGRYSHEELREIDAFCLRFGIGCDGEATQKQVADRLGISQSYISRLEKKIISRLRGEMMKQMQ